MKSGINKRKIASVFAALMASGMLLTGCGTTQHREHPALLEPANVKLETTQVVRNELSSIRVLDARIIPNTAEISFDEGGYLYDLYVSVGEELYEGKVIASMVGPDFNTITDLEEEIETLSEENEKMEAYREAQLELARLSGQKTEELELTQRQEREEAQLKLEQKERKLEQLKETDIGYTYIEAPYDCTVIAVTNSRSGSYISSTVPLIAVSRPGNPMLTCEYISEKNLNALDSYYALIHGDRYELRYIPYSKEELALMAANSVKVVSRFEVIGDDLSGITVGDYAAVIFVEECRENVLSVPINAVYSDSEGKFVYEVVDNTRIRRSVVTGVSDSTNVEIIEGIEEGASIYVKN